MNVLMLRLARLVGLLWILGIVVCGGALAQVVYTSNFALEAGAEWSARKTEKTPNGSTFLGSFGNESVELALSDLPEHTYVSLTFDLYAIGGWEGNGDLSAPDVFSVRVPGDITLVQTSFSNIQTRQAWPEAAPYSDYSARRDAYRSNSLGFTSPGDTTYRIARTFPHREGALVLQFFAKGLSANATWGLNNVRVTLLSTRPNSVVSNGDFELPAITTVATYSPPNTLYGWTVASGTVSIRRGWDTASGERFLDLAATQAGSVVQEVPVLPGQKYDLRFQLAGNPMTSPAVKQVRILWGETELDTLSFDTMGHSLQDLGWEKHRYVVTAPNAGTTMRLSFQAVSTGSGGPILDGVSLTPIVPGDVNGDGYADLLDALVTTRMIAGTDPIDMNVLVRADVAPYAGTVTRVRGDGSVNVADVRTSLLLAGSGPSYLDLAQSAVNDLYRRFWVGSPTTGHVLPTWGGQYNTSFPNGSMWEHAQMLRTMMDLYRVAPDSALRTRIQSDWNWITSTFSASALTSVGAGTNMNWSDDAGWSTLMYLDVHRITGSSTALTHARNLFNNAYNRWVDSTYGGGMWYTDEHLQKSVYQVSMVLAGLRLYDLTGVTSFKDRALALYQWVDAYLARGRGIYYVDYDQNGQVKNNAPPRQASSDTMLAGNMAMAVAAARIYRASGNTAYLEKAVRTANAILAIENDGGGLYMNDRDANVEGFYIGDWVAEVLSLPGVGPEHATALRRTATSIYAAARTPDGYYSGNWSGPAQGPLAVWGADGKSFIPQQIVISSNSVHMIVGAAAIGVLEPAEARAFSM